MPTLSETEIAELLAPYFIDIKSGVVQKLSRYLDLLLRWNAKTNLTAIRDPQEIVRRHFGESLFAGRHLREGSDAVLPPTLLDLGSGAGFPGLPIALLYPGIQVTLAESQGKKAAFLREAVRTLGTENVEVWAGRAEALAGEKRFHTVALRAVDHMEAALAAAISLASSQIVVLSSAPPALPPEFRPAAPIAMPGAETTAFYRAVRVS